MIIKDEVKKRTEQAVLSKDCPNCETIGRWEVEVAQGNHFDPPKMKESILVLTLICLECRYIKHEVVSPSITF
jgi:C4-type Zn-finger protein